MIIDFHSHILPQMDDGSQSVEESIEILRRMKSQGIDVVVATPHFYADRDFPEKFLHRRTQAVEQLNAAKKEVIDFPKILLGAEVAYFRGMSESKVLQDLAIEGTKAVLVEMPMGKWSESMYHELERIYTYQGLIPIVAHVDRYLTPHRSFGIPKKLEKLPVLVQANGEFFLDKSMSRKARKMLEAEQIHLLGSDTHNLKERGPNLGDAVKVITESLGMEAIARIEACQKTLL